MKTETFESKLPAMPRGLFDSMSINDISKHMSNNTEYIPMTNDHYDYYGLGTIGSNEVVTTVYANAAQYRSACWAILKEPRVLIKEFIVEEL